MSKIKNFEVLRQPISQEAGWEKDLFIDLSGNNLPTRFSERSIIFEVLKHCGVVDTESDIESLTDFALDQVLMYNNIYVSFIDSTE